MVNDQLLMVNGYTFSLWLCIYFVLRMCRLNIVAVFSKGTGAYD